MLAVNLKHGYLWKHLSFQIREGTEFESVLLSFLSLTGSISGTKITMNASCSILLYILSYITILKKRMWVKCIQLLSPGCASLYWLLRIYVFLGSSMMLVFSINRLYIAPARACSSSSGSSALLLNCPCDWYGRVLKVLYTLDTTVSRACQTRDWSWVPFKHISMCIRVPLTLSQTPPVAWLWHCRRELTIGIKPRETWHFDKRFIPCHSFVAKSLGQTSNPLDNDYAGELHMHRSSERVEHFASYREQDKSLGVGFFMIEGWYLDSLSFWED